MEHLKARERERDRKEASEKLIGTKIERLLVVWLVLPVKEGS